MQILHEELSVVEVLALAIRSVIFSSEELGWHLGSMAHTLGLLLLEVTVLVVEGRLLLGAVMLEALEVFCLLTSFENLRKWSSSFERASVWGVLGVLPSSSFELLSFILRFFDQFSVLSGTLGLLLFLGAEELVETNGTVFEVFW